MSLLGDGSGPNRGKAKASALSVGVSRSLLKSQRRRFEVVHAGQPNSLATGFRSYASGKLGGSSAPRRNSTSAFTSSLPRLRALS